MTRIAGFGHNRAACVGSLADALARAGGAERLAALEDRSALVVALGARLGLPVVVVPHAAAAAQSCLTDSPRCRAATGLASVAEAVALAAALAAALAVARSAARPAARSGARLLAPRSRSADGNATAAIAIALSDPETP